MLSDLCGRKPAGLFVNGNAGCKFFEETTQNAPFLYFSGMGGHKSFYWSGFFQVFTNKQINENMTRMASPSRRTGMGHFFYGRKIIGFDAGPNRRFTHLMALADGVIIFDGGVFHIGQNEPLGAKGE